MTTRGSAGAVAGVVIAVVAAVLGRELPLPVAIFLAVLLAVVLGAVVATSEARWVTAAAEHINGWLGRDRHDALAIPIGRHWAQLQIAINALGAAYDRRGDKLSRERPWRADLVDSLTAPALLFSRAGRLLAANDAARELLTVARRGTTAVQALGSAALAGAVEESRESGLQVTVDARVGDRDLRAVATTVGDETLVVVTDATIERRVEEVRRNFVVNASHELKTPAAGIQALADALAVTVSTDPERSELLVGQLREQSERLVRLVRDLLDLRRLEDGGPGGAAPVELAALVRRVASELQGRADERGIEIAVEAPPSVTVVGSSDDLSLIVSNLIANAIQYNRDGGRVVVRLEPEPEPGRGGHVLTVSDDGVGIPQSDLQRVFERFYRVDVARSRAAGGTGLGLSIVRHAVDRQGGTVRVESLLGEGSSFIVTIPLEPRTHA